MMSKIVKIRNSLSILALTSVFALALAGCGSSNNDSSNGGAASPSASESASPAAAETPKEKVKVRIALDTAAGGSLQFRLAEEKGLFDKYGIDAEISNFPYGIDTLNALLVGRADTGTAADYALLNSLNKGDFKVASALSRETPESATSTVVIAKGDDIKTPQDLKGKKLGVAKGTVFEYVWAKYLESIGVAESDVKFVPYSSPDEAMVGLQKGQMDAVLGSGVFIDKFLGINGTKKIGDLADAGTDITAYFAVTSDFLKKNPDAVGGILKALDEAIAYIPGHEEELAEIAFKELKLPKDGVLKTIDQQGYAVGFSQEDYDHLKSMKQFIVDKGILKDDYDLNAKLDLEPAKQALPNLVSYQP
jgi:ABC-type nitrate/sulfonate/bicarbonate transport systems, periplasmic components